MVLQNYNSETDTACVDDKSDVESTQDETSVTKTKPIRKQYKTTDRYQSQAACASTRYFVAH